jgi:hypothetical protein
MGTGSKITPLPPCVHEYGGSCPRGVGALGAYYFCVLKTVFAIVTV